MNTINFKEHISWELSKDFNNAIYPAIKKYNLSFVSYASFQEEGMAIIYNNRECIHHTVNELGMNPSGWTLSRGRYRWIDYMPQNVLHDMEEYYGINTHSGITLVNDFSSFIEVFNIAVSKDTHSHMNQYYYGNNLLLSISQDIRHLAKDILDEIADHPIFYTDEQKKLIEYSKHNREKYKQNQLPQSLKVIGNKGTISLTHKEIICLYYILQLHSNTQISDIMQITIKTVEYYMQNIRSKLGVNNRQELFTIAKNNFLLDFIY